MDGRKLFDRCIDDWSQRFGSPAFHKAGGVSGSDWTLMGDGRLHMLPGVPNVKSASVS